MAQDVAKGEISFKKCVILQSQNIRSPLTFADVFDEV